MGAAWGYKCLDCDMRTDTWGINDKRVLRNFYNMYLAIETHWDVSIGVELYAQWYDQGAVYAF